MHDSYHLVISVVIPQVILTFMPTVPERMRGGHALLYILWDVISCCRWCIDMQRSIDYALMWCWLTHHKSNFTKNSLFIAEVNLWCSCTRAVFTFHTYKVLPMGCNPLINNSHTPISKEVEFIFSRLKTHHTICQQLELLFFWDRCWSKSVISVITKTQGFHKYIDATFSPFPAHWIYHLTFSTHYTCSIARE